MRRRRSLDAVAVVRALAAALIRPSTAVRGLRRIHFRLVRTAVRRRDLARFRIRGPSKHRPQDTPSPRLLRLRRQPVRIQLQDSMTAVSIVQRRGRGGDPVKRCKQTRRRWLVVTADDDDSPSGGWTARRRRQWSFELLRRCRLKRQIIRPDLFQPVQKGLVDMPSQSVRPDMKSAGSVYTHESVGEGSLWYRATLQHNKRWKYARTIGLQWLKYW